MQWKKIGVPSLGTCFPFTYRDGEHIANEMHHIRAHDGREFSLSDPVAHIQLIQSL